MPTSPVENALEALHDAYIERINAAVAEDRMDLVEELSDRYTDEALELLLTLEKPGIASAHQAQAQTVVPQPGSAPRGRIRGGRHAARNVFARFWRRPDRPA